MEGKLTEQQAAEIKSMVDAATAPVAKTVEEMAALVKKLATEPATAHTAGLAATPGLDAREPAEKGGGWKIARIARVKALAHVDRRNALDVAKEIAKGDRRYEETVKAMGASTVSGGGSLLDAPTHTDYIDALKAVAVVRSFGPNVLPMPSGLLDLGSLESGATAAYVGENANATKSEQTTGRKQLSAKKLMVLVPIGNDLLRRGGGGVESMLRDDIVARAALREDLAFIRGDGSSNTPKGLKTHTAAANTFGIVGTDTAGIVGTVHKARRALKNGNVPMLRCGWAFSPRTEEALFQVRDAVGGFLFKQEMESGKLLGYPYKTTTQIPDNLGGGTNESEIYLADYSEVIIGDTMGIDVSAFDGGSYFDGSSVISGISQDQTVLRLIAEHDLITKHSVSSVVVTGVTWGA